MKTRPHITIDAKDYGFTLPAQIPAGWVDVTLHNSGKVGHQIAFAKLGSVSFAAFKTAASATDVKALAGVQFVGGPNNVDPGRSVTATVHFEPGEYGVACFIPDDKDGKSHAEHGMVGEVNVVKTADFGRGHADGRRRQHLAERVHVPARRVVHGHGHRRRSRTSARRSTR